MTDHLHHFVFCAAVPYRHSLSGRSRLLAESLAERGYPVTYVELPCLRGMMRRGPSSAAAVQVRRLVSWPGFRRITRLVPHCLWLPQAQRRLRRLANDDPQTVLVVSAPFWQPIIAAHTQARVCYDYLDSLEVHAPNSGLAHMQILDDRLLARADLVTPVSEHLAEDIRRRFPASILRVIPNGVPEAWLAPRPRPLERGALGLKKDRPIIGFLGALFEWIDFDLILEAAAALPRAQIVLVGPTRPGVSVERLRAVPNIQLFPAQPYGEVPRWMDSFDVCLVPFKRNVVSHMADPLKIYEYLALGKQVVSTHPFGPSCDRAPLRVGNTTEEFIACIRLALEEGNRGEQQRRSYASRHTWRARTDALLAALSDTTIRRAA